MEPRAAPPSGGCCGCLAGLLARGARREGPKPLPRGDSASSTSRAEVRGGAAAVDMGDPEFEDGSDAGGGWEAPGWATDEVRGCSAAAIGASEAECSGASDEANTMSAVLRPVVEDCPRRRRAAPDVEEQLLPSPTHSTGHGCQRRCCETPSDVDPFLLAHESAFASAPALRLDSNASSLFKSISRIGTNSTCTGSSIDVQTDGTNEDRVTLQDYEVRPRGRFGCASCRCGFCM
mmetsp:Transcript_128039/g.362400  ORF Transcript_128039/g.362400 Transcript_128039/m.362400 type:complete len:234 (+) Transcript_128039:87-788(+)